MIIKSFLNSFIYLLFLSSIPTTSIAKKIVCYYSSWAIYYEDGFDVQPDDINANLCTHINYAFINIKEDGSLEVDDEYADIELDGFNRLTSLKEKNSELKVLLSIGGASVSADIFSSIAASKSKRTKMIQSARKFVDKYNFDGVDIDWEVPEEDDEDNFILLLQEFKDDFETDNWLVSIAVSSDPSDGYNVAKISEIVDFINLMTYDMYGPWSDYTGQNSPLYASSVEDSWEKKNLNLNASVLNWIKKGASANKICAGLAFYGHTFTLESPSNHGIHAPIEGAGNPGLITEEEGSLAYFEYCTNEDDWNCIWDDEQKNPICLKGDQWLGFDNQKSIELKVEFINSLNLAGAMIWSIDQDDVHGKCGSANLLLNTIKDNLI